MTAVTRGSAPLWSGEVPPLDTRADVTPAWLSAVIGRVYPGVAVVSAKVGQFLGFKPNKLRLELAYNATGDAAGLPRTLILKASFGGGGEVGQGLDFAAAAEAVSYRDFVPGLGIATPQAYVIALDDVTGRAVLLLEDLAARNVTFLNAFTPLDFGAAAAFVDGLATIHAALWNDPALGAGGAFGPATPLGRSRQIYHAAMREFVSADPVYARSMTSHRNLPRAAVLPRALSDQPRLEAAIETSLAALRQTALVMIHGDEHLGNLYIAPDGTPGFLDWFARPDPWSIGFAYFLAVAVDMLDRRNWEKPLLARYLQSLQCHGVTPPSFEQAWFEYRCSLVWPLATWFVNPGEWQPERINTVNASRATLAVIDHDSFGLLGV